MKRPLLHSAVIDSNGKRTVRRCLLLSGLPGSGLTIIAKALEGWIHLNTEDFLVDPLPKIRLSNGDRISNLYSPGAIDWNELNFGVKQALTAGNVILTTALPLIERYEFVIDYHISLTLEEDRIGKVAAALAKARRAKTPLQVARCMLIAKEIIERWYLKTSNCYVDDTIAVYHSNGRSQLIRPLGELLAEVRTSWETFYNSTYFCAGCLAVGSCSKCYGQNPAVIVRARYNYSSQKWIYGQSFIRIDEVLNRNRLALRNLKSESPYPLFELVTYLCAKCRGERAEGGRTNCSACERDTPKMIVKFTWKAGTDSYEYSCPFIRTFEWVAAR